MDETLNMTIRYAPIGVWTGVAIGVFATVTLVSLAVLALWCRSLSARVEKWARRTYEAEKGKKADG